MRTAIKPFKPVERPIRVSVGVVTQPKHGIQVNRRTHIKTVSGWLKRSEWMRRAANLLVNHWTQGELTDYGRGKKENFCMLGALGKVKTGNAAGSYKIPVPRELKDVVGGYVPYFNDNPSNTELDCIAALRIAADLAECNGR